MYYMVVGSIIEMWGFFKIRWGRKVNQLKKASGSIATPSHSCFPKIRVA